MMINQILAEYLKKIIDDSPEDTFVELIFKKYIQLEGAVNLAKYLNGNEIKIKTDSKIGERKYTSTDIVEIVLDEENQKQVNTKLAFLVDKLVRYTGKISWNTKLFRVLKFMAGNDEKVNEWRNNALIDIKTSEFMKLNNPPKKKPQKMVLTEKQKMFCLHYIKNFNEKQAAINAGYPAHSAAIQGRKLIRDESIKNYIQELKKKTAEDLLIDAQDVMERYVKIAMADMTDFVEFGERETVVYDELGLPAKDDKGKIITTKRSYLKFKESEQVDGGLICEISTGKNGMKLKLEDRQKALDKLATLFDLFPDKFNRDIKEKELSHRMDIDSKKYW